jgi:hypothetical protein
VPQGIEEGVYITQSKSSHNTIPAHNEENLCNSLTENLLSKKRLWNINAIELFPVHE